MNEHKNEKISQKKTGIIKNRNKRITNNNMLPKTELEIRLK